MKIFLVCILFLLAIFIMVRAPHCHAQSEIVVVRGQDFPPYHFIDSSGQETGFVIEIISGTANLMDMKVAFKQYSWSRCLQMVKTGRADAMMNLFKTSDRIKFMSFSNNILAREINRFFKLKNASFDFSGDMADISPLKIGAIRNYSYGAKFDAVSFPRMFRLETEELLVKSLVNKRCDVIVGNEIVIALLSSQMGLKNKVESLPGIVSNDPLYLGFSKAKGHEKLSDRFSDALSRFKQIKQYAAILKKYSL